MPAESTVTSYVKRFEKCGHIERVPHPTDGRSNSIRLTDAGRLTHHAAVERFLPAVQAVDGDWDRPGHRCCRRCSRCARRFALRPSSDRPMDPRDDCGQSRVAPGQDVPDSVAFRYHIAAAVRLVTANLA